MSDMSALYARNPGVYDGLFCRLNDSGKLCIGLFFFRFETYNSSYTLGFEM